MEIMTVRLGDNHVIFFFFFKKGMGNQYSKTLYQSWFHTKERNKNKSMKRLRTMSKPQSRLCASHRVVVQVPHNAGEISRLSDGRVGVGVNWGVEEWGADESGVLHTLALVGGQLPSARAACGNRITPCVYTDAHTQCKGIYVHKTCINI